MAWVRYWVTERLVVAITEPEELVVRSALGTPVTASAVVVAPVARRSVAKKVVEVALVSKVLPESVVEAIDALPETTRLVVLNAVVVALVPVALTKTNGPVSVVEADARPPLNVMSVVVALLGNG